MASTLDGGTVLTSSSSLSVATATQSSLSLLSTIATLTTESLEHLPTTSNTSTGVESNDTTSTAVAAATTVVVSALTRIGITTPDIGVTTPSLSPSTPTVHGGDIVSTVLTEYINSTVQLFMNSSEGTTSTEWLLTSETSSDHLHDDSPSHCDRGALVDSWGIFIQAVLALVAFSTLLLKRLREPRSFRRPWKIWMLDTSKQAFGQLLIHFANVFLSDIYSGDPCTWYIMNFLLDSTVGLIIIFICLRVIRAIARWKKIESLKFGEYGDPPDLQAWMVQCGLYLVVVLIMKIIISSLLTLTFWEKVRDVLMGPFSDPKLEVVIVMLIVPFFFNTFMFWVVDNILMRHRQRKPQLSYISPRTSIKYSKVFQSRDSESDDQELLCLDEHPDGSVHIETTRGVVIRNNGPVSGEYTDSPHSNGDVNHVDV